VGAEAVGDTLADLLAEDGIGGNTFFFDETFDLLFILSAYVPIDCIAKIYPQCPMSS